MSIWTAQRVAVATRGSWRRTPVGPLRGASIDTRDITPGQLFFALRGGRVDGHAFVRDAAERGAGAAVVQDADAAGVLPDGFGLLRVADVRTALVELAKACRASRPGLAVVGVTGSNGKTTTTRLIHSALAGSRRGTCSRRSFNNDLGLPLTLLNAGATDDYVVCEMGSSGPGEIARLARIARPDIGVVTSIGRAHLEGFGSLEGVVREKGSLVLALAAGAMGVVPDDSPELDELVRGARCGVVRVGVGDRAGVRVSITRAGPDGIGFEAEGFGPLDVPLLGAHNARNAAMAAVVARRLGADDASIRAGLAAATGVEMRLAVEHVETPGGPVTLVNDAYNANPDSMRAALATLASIAPGEGGRRIAVLGDMLELGPASASEHEALLAQVPRAIDLVHAVGPAMAGAGGSGPRVRSNATLDDRAIAAIITDLRSGDVLLLKGSRGMRLERIADAVRAPGAVHSSISTDGG